MSEQTFVLLNNTLVAGAIIACTALVAIYLSSPAGLWSLLLFMCWQVTDCDCRNDEEAAKAPEPISATTQTKNG